MADKQHGGAVFPAQIFDKIDHRRLDRHIERGGRFIKDQKRGFRHQGHGDDDALLLAARQLVRVGAQHPLGVGQADIADHFQRARPCLFLRYPFMDHRHFHQLLTDPHRGIERGHGFLIDHRDFAATNGAQLLCAHRVQITAFVLDRAADDAAVDAQILHHPQSDGGFAATAFAHKPHRLARHDRAGEIHHGGDFTQPGEKGNRQIGDFKDWAIIGFRCNRRGLRGLVKHSYAPPRGGYKSSYEDL